MSSRTIELTPERWRRVEELFAAAQARDPAARSAYLAEACGDDAELRRYVESLLGADPAIASSVEDAISRTAREAFADEREAEDGIAGTRIGAYRIERLLGYGGMGVVYLARRDDRQFERQVAIKLGKRRLLDPMTEARLRSERQILANLDHPNVARLLDGGTTEDGVPYLVMEYIDGIRIDEYCDRHRLSIRERLELFRVICDAVHYAHQALVVHRDIKPSNILVTAKGEPKLLDFGIAKLVDAEGVAGDGLTRTGVAVLTPEHASPEQLAGRPVTTATDVYALGVLLHQLLTGLPLHDLQGLSPAEVARTVCQVPPLKPSDRLAAAQRARGDSVGLRAVARDRQLQVESLIRTLKGDLDTIVLKAVHKEPERRYVSAAKLSDDVDAYLKSLPISAQPDSWAYRTGKFVRRHKLAVAMSGAFLAVLYTMLVALFVQNERIMAERDHAREIARFLEDIFTSPDPANTRGLDITAKEILATGAARITTELANKPEIQSSLMETIGRVYLNLGEYAPSIDMLEKSLELRMETLGSDHPTVAQAKNELAAALIRKAEYTRARTLLEESLELNRREQGAASREVAENLYNLAELHLAMGELDSAERYAKESIDIYTPIQAEHAIELAEAKNALARILQVRGDLDRTEALLREAIGIVEARAGSDHPLMAYYLQNLGVLLKSKGDLDAAERTLNEAIDAARRILGEKHDLVATTLAIQGSLLHGRGDYPAAEQAYREALALDAEARGESHPFVGYDMTSLAMLLHDKGDLAGAESLLGGALAIYAESLDENHQYVASALTELGAVLTSAGRPGEALAHLERALEIRRLDYAEDTVFFASTLSEYGSALLALGDTDRARPLIERSAAVLAEHDDRRARRARMALAHLQETASAHAPP
ncbi:MAG TPA: serine/threonine-protein kinase [Woeseiaceae bacterium]|nr:serine/threonine-protein kinase [Woeseiaceae bacterium]